MTNTALPEYLYTQVLKDWSFLLTNEKGSRYGHARLKDIRIVVLCTGLLQTEPNLIKKMKSIHNRRMLS